MALADAIRVTVQVDAHHSVSGLFVRPLSARACYVFAHGAGAGMTHRSMEKLAVALGEAGIASLRFQFPYMERGSRRPDDPAVCHATVRAAVHTGAQLACGLPLIAGGRSFGGRMTSQAQAENPLPGIRGLAFLAFPLHPARQPSDERARHLFNVRVPMLFLQGTRDQLAETGRLRKLSADLGPRATLRLIEGADHSFHVPARSGRSDAQVTGELMTAFGDWLDAVTA